jgi:hypothetical protein
MKPAVDGASGTPGRRAGRPPQVDLLPEQRALFLLARIPSQFDEGAAELPSLLRDCNASHLVRLATEHLVYPLVAYNLKRSGEAFEAAANHELQLLFRASHRNGLLLAHALSDLLGKFDNAGIEAVCFKGPVFALTNYGDLRWRVYGDLDVFVSVADVTRSRDLLVGLGFAQLDPLPHQVGGRFRSYWPFGFPHGNAVGFSRNRGTESQVDVDLQWGAAPHFLKVPIEPAEMLARSRAGALFDREVRTFDPADTLMLMCLHGAKHAWTELRQVVDVAACLGGGADLDWEGVLARISEARLVRVCALAIRLAETLLGASVPAPYRDRLVNEAEADVMDSLVSHVIAWRFGASGQGAAIGRRRMAAVRYHLSSRDRLYHGLGSVVYHIRDALR